MTKETLSGYSNSIITGCENIPSNITFDELVQKVGGKAAGLLWINKYCPEIPTAKMIVAPPGNSVQDIYDAARLINLKFPWIIRASTPLDNLPGYEDIFPTRYASRSYAIDYIHTVKHSPSVEFGFGPGGYDFDEATVIVAEQTTSNFVGTLVEHPHKDAMYANVDNIKNLDDRDHAAYLIDYDKTIRLQRRSLLGHQKTIPLEIDERVNNIAKLYKSITNMPGFNHDMTYQLEFCPEPLFVYQVRDFLPKVKSDFIVEGIEDHYSDGETERIIFGITPKEGVVVLVREYDDSWHDTIEETATHSIRRHVPFIEEYPGNVDPKENIGLIIPVRKVGRVRFPRYANLFTQSTGMLTHDDIKAIRTTPLSIVNNGSYDWYIGEKYKYLEDGDIVRIFSDGLNLKLQKEKAKK